MFAQRRRRRWRSRHGHGSDAALQTLQAHLQAGHGLQLAEGFVCSLAVAGEQPIDGDEEDAELRDEERSHHSEEGCGGEERVHAAWSGPT